MRVAGLLFVRDTQLDNVISISNSLGLSPPIRMATKGTERALVHGEISWRPERELL